MPINKAVRGLPDFLGLYQGGAVSLEAGAVTFGAYNISPFIQPPEWEYNSGFAGAHPWSVIFEVPTGEIWHLLQMSMQMALPIAGDLAFVYPFFNPGLAAGAGFIEYALNDGMRGTNSNNLAIASAHTFGNPLVLQSGNIVGFHVPKQTSTGNLTLEAAIQFQRIRA